MAQDFSFSWSIDSQTQAPPAAASGNPDNALIALAACTHYPLPGNRVVLARRFSDARTVVTGEVLHALGLCTSFRTLDQHAQVMVEALPEIVENLDDARQAIGSLVNSGFFISSRDLEHQFQAGRPEPDEGRRTAVCIATCDRPQQLGRVLESVLAHPREGVVRYYLIDDSRQPDNIAKNREITQLAAQQHGLPLRYLGPQEQAERIGRLKQQLPKWQAEIEFLLGRFATGKVPSYGRALNHALLLSRGGALVYVDDDTLCRGYPSLLGTQNESLFDDSRRAADFLPSGHVWEELEDRAVDPVAEFSRYAGRRTVDVVTDMRQQGIEPSLAGAGAGQATALLTGESAVAVVACGVYGDPGTSGHQWLFDLQGGSRDRLIQDEATYRRVMSERNVWMGRDRAHFGLGHAMLSVNKCLDHSRPLPPAFPLLRNEDMLFGRMLSAMRPDHLFLELPWAVPHLPAEKRSWPDAVLDQPMMLGFSRFCTLQIAARQAGFVTRDPIDRLGLLGDLFSDLGSASPRLLKEELGQTLLRVRSDLVSRLAQGLESGDALPEFYRRDIMRQIQANEQLLLNVGAPGPYDIFEAFPDADPVETSKRLWKVFADAVYAWQDILDAAGNPWDQ